MNRYDAVVIGAGIGGLVCGCYLAKSGLKVCMLEQHDKPGGYCTSFLRNGYRFDVGVHYLGGIKKGILRTVLDDLGIADQIKFHRFDPSDKILTPDTTVCVRADFRETVAELKEKYPNEHKQIDDFFKFLLQDNFIDIYKKTRYLTFRELLDDFFRDYRLKGILNVLLRNLGLCAADASALSFIILIREYILDPGYYPLGGMQAFADTLAKNFVANGGEILLNTKVNSIEFFGERVTAVGTVKNEIFETNAVVSNVDALTTFNSLLRLRSKEQGTVKKMIASPSAFIVYLGVGTGWKNITDSSANVWPFFTYDLGKTPLLSSDDIRNKNIFVTMISFPSSHDPSLTTSGDRTTVGIFAIVPFFSDNFWQEHKDFFAEVLVDKVVEMYPRMDGKVEQKIVATPCTLERYTSNHEGSAFGWASTVNQLRSSLVPTKSSLKGLYLTGHWCTVGSGQGGVPKVCFSGRKSAQTLLRDIGKGWTYDEYFL